MSLGRVHEALEDEAPSLQRTSERETGIRSKAVLLVDGEFDAVASGGVFRQSQMDVFDRGAVFFQSRTRSACVSAVISAHWCCVWSGHLLALRHPTHQGSQKGKKEKKGHANRKKQVQGVKGANDDDEERGMWWRERGC